MKEDKKKAELLSKPQPKKAPGPKSKDRAETLAEMIAQLQQSYGNTFVQRLLSAVQASPSGVALPGGGGQHLDAETKSAMGSTFETDFDAVRIHTDHKAHEAAETLGARAFTHGQDIYFGQGEYNPATRSGKELLAHELTHVVQQQGQTTSPQAKVEEQDFEVFESEADQAAEAVLSGQRPHIRSHPGVPAIQRQEREETPSIHRHAIEITPMPVSGTINAAGRFSIAYLYNLVTGADFLPLTLAIPSGVAVSIIPLTDLGTSDYRIHDPGGTGARAVTISVTLHMVALPKIQVTLTQGSFTYVVVFQFMQSGASGESSEG